MIASLENVTYGMNLSILSNEEIRNILDLIDFFFKS